MVRQHHQLNGRESEQVPGDGEGQGSLACMGLGHDLATEQQQPGYNEARPSLNVLEKAPEY